MHCGAFDPWIFRGQVVPRNHRHCRCRYHAGLIDEIRFRVVWGAGKMTREEIEGVGFEWCDCSEMMQVKESLAGHGGVVD